ncbi:TPA: hypothetical protein R9Y26_006386, partial [Bacillus cereus]|nr:hypothetical protein [Bacillus cereus]
GPVGNITGGIGAKVGPITLGFIAVAQNTRLTLCSLFLLNILSPHHLMTTWGIDRKKKKNTLRIFELF